MWVLKIRLLTFLKIQNYYKIKLPRCCKYSTNSDACPKFFNLSDKTINAVKKNILKTNFKSQSLNMMSGQKKLLQSIIGKKI